ncbi:MAG: hypothetical protein SP1CHLAM54_01410 [Chlamydiia bacterium]|nr:hypothetical protein [Chlamydiia bacterium]MCH9615061.1 hypothetical protein [Chlamydiia bacterium]MCH9629889.1 hypothetical protein [Chlamydiia bacterium]
MALKALSAQTLFERWEAVNLRETTACMGLATETLTQGVFDRVLLVIQACHTDRVEIDGEVRERLKAIEETEHGDGAIAAGTVGALCIIAGWVVPVVKATRSMGVVSLVVGVVGTVLVGLCIRRHVAVVKVEAGEGSLHPTSVQHHKIADTAARVALLQGLQTPCHDIGDVLDRMALYDAFPGAIHGSLPRSLFNSCVALDPVAGDFMTGRRAFPDPAPGQDFTALGELKDAYLQAHQVPPPPGLPTASAVMAGARAVDPADEADPPSPQASVGEVRVAVQPPPELVTTVPQSAHQRMLSRLPGGDDTGV